ncbi:hypothetical protein VTN00DRAFT_1646 [Thermoascus crustaceus]|uniref:uncharacterized protein n=1 Tax=Thermoascus crustaceus TaxID=5088 RepID=UPI00374326B3
MKFTVAVFSLFAALAVALPITTYERTDTAPAMTTTQGEVVPFNSADVVTKE